MSLLRHSGLRAGDLRVGSPSTPARGVPWPLLRKAARNPPDTGAARELLIYYGLSLPKNAPQDPPEWWHEHQRHFQDATGHSFDLVSGLPVRVIRVVDDTPMVLIPGGSFLMGWTQADCEWVERNFGRFKIFTDDPAGGYQRRVVLSPYYIDAHSVTRQQYRRVYGTSLITRLFVVRRDHPVTNVSWFDALDYATRVGASLPTEAQWERAARGGRNARYPWGDAPPDASRANYEDHYGGTTSVTKFSPNPFGLYDMAGNVYDWCGDWSSACYYMETPPRDPRGPAIGVKKVLRGASWGRWADDDSALVHVAFKHEWEPRDRAPWWGFRCVIPICAQTSRPGDAWPVGAWPAR